MVKYKNYCGGLDIFQVFFYKNHKINYCLIFHIAKLFTNKFFKVIFISYFCMAKNNPINVHARDIEKNTAEVPGKQER